jgi:receptor expression-enhancing protein 5/6
LLTKNSGAQIIFRSFLTPTLGRYFNHGSTASNLRSKAEGFNKSE